MRISTIIAAYNSEAYLAQALDSVFAQTRPSDEIIVVDDGSTDRTPEMLAGYGKRIRVVTQPNMGPARALNAALAIATGDTLAFLDSDDLWVPSKLQVQSVVLESDPEMEAVFGWVQQFASHELDPSITRDYVVNEAPQRGISKNTILLWRKALDRIGPFREDYAVGDFVEWYSRASALGLRWHMLPEVLAMRRHHPGNTGRRLKTLQREETLLALKRSLDLRRGKSTAC